MILAIASVEDDTNIRKQIAKQTIQPDEIYIYVDKNPARSLNLRRKKIAENQNILKGIVETYDADIIWQLEGDDDLPENALEKLLEDYYNNPDGYVSGIQVGRHGLYCLGAWQFAEDFKSFKSLDHTLKGLQEVDATGFYCLLTSKEIWLKGLAEWEDEPYGPDVNWGISLRAQGYKIYCDMDVKVGHIIKGGIIHPDNISTCNVQFTNIEGRWHYKTT